MSDVTEKAKVEFLTRVRQVAAAMSVRNEKNAFNGLWRSFGYLARLAGELGYEWVPAKRKLYVDTVGGRVHLSVWIARPLSFFYEYSLEDGTAKFHPSPPAVTEVRWPADWTDVVDGLPNPLRLPGGMTARSVDTDRIPLPEGAVGKILDVLREWEVVVAAHSPAARPYRGLQEPDLLWWDGKSVEVPKTLWRLLGFMWDKEHAKIPDVEQHVWGDEAETDARLKSALTKLNNNVLMHNNIPLVLHRKGGFVVKETC